MKRSILKKAALIYAANTVRVSLETGASFDPELSEKDSVYFQETIAKIADKISVIHASTMDECLEIALTT